jgi:hypothetical protein
MTAISSGLHFLSGIALHFGALPVRNFAKPAPRKTKRREQPANGSYTPLSERQKKELLESIRHDDWFE